MKGCGWSDGPGKLQAGSVAFHVASAADGCLGESGQRAVLWWGVLGWQIVFGAGGGAYLLCGDTQAAGVDSQAFVWGIGVDLLAWAGQFAGDGGWAFESG